MSENKYAVDASFTEESAGSKWISPCSLERVIIQEVKFIKSSQKGTPGIQIEVRNGSEEDSQKCIQTYWLSEKALLNTKKNLSIIADKLGVFENVSNKWNTCQSDEDFAAAFSSEVTGKQIMILFAGEQNWLKDEESGTYREWVKPVFNPFKFAANVNDTEKIAELTKFLEKNKDKMIKLSPKPEEIGSSDGGSGGSVNW